MLTIKETNTNKFFPMKNLNNKIFKVIKSSQTSSKNGKITNFMKMAIGKKNYPFGGGVTLLLGLLDSVLVSLV